ncbi:hypothetical protein LCGC14_2062550, partial [marine sediment metagenome]
MLTMCPEKWFDGPKAVVLRFTPSVWYIPTSTLSPAVSERTSVTE